MAKVKILLAILALILPLSPLGAMLSHDPAAATPDEVEWSRVNIPTEGEAGNWVLANGSNVKHLTMAADGTLYAYANPSGTSYRLFKSTDGGFSWTYCGQVTDTIVDIATAPEDASIIYYATVSNIYQSTDAGLSFTRWPSSPGGAGSGNITITAIAVAAAESSNIIAVATRDSDNARYGGIYLLDENEPFSGWIDTNLGNYDAYAVAFSPNYVTDRQLVAVVTDEQDTLVTTKTINGDWGGVIGNATIKSLVPGAAAIAFPDDYDATIEDYALFVALDSGGNNGDVYIVNGISAPGSSVATDLNIGAAYNLDNVDVSGLVVSGNTITASLMAGAANSAQVYLSTDSGLNWSRSRKQPTGDSKTYLLMAPDFTSSGLAYAATSGQESAFSYTLDGGITWNQAGLIDSKISTNGITDLAISPSYNQQAALFLLTFNSEHSEHSLWRSLDGGARWERTFTRTLAGVDSLDLIELAPGDSSHRQVLFLAGSSGGNSVIWKSTDNGQTFARRDAPFAIDAWAVVNDTTLFVGSYNGSSGLVHRSTNSGLAYSTPAAAGSQPLKSIALSPDYEQDNTLLVSNTSGWVYRSDDNGASFQPLPADATSAPLSGSITIAFDPEYSRNKIIYAASATADQGIYRFTIDRSTVWESIDSNLPSGGIINQLAVSSDGTLYATNLKADGGMERSLNPTLSLGPTFETVTRGLDDSAELNGLWLQDNQLWSIDNQNLRLMTYLDSLTLPVSLTTPADQASGTGTDGVVLDWQTLEGATEYKWQLDYDGDFSTVPSGFEGEIKASSVRVPALDMATTYYWRVRATEPVLSRWSNKWSFTTSLGDTVPAPVLYSPKASASDVTIKPVFQFGALAGAESYELLVATDASFSNPVIVKVSDYALPATAWQSNINLDYNTTYYWKVRASGSGSYSAWSAVSAFTTQLPPPPPAAAPPASEPPLLPSPPLSPVKTSPLSSSPQETAVLSTPPPEPLPLPPSSPLQSIMPDWFTYLAGALLLTIVILLVTLLVLVAGIRRS